MIDAKAYMGDLIGGLLIAESRTIAATLLQHLPEADWKRLFEVENILFNIDSRANTDEQENTILKVFNERVGYCADFPHIAHLERELDGKGQYQEFKDKFAELTGSTAELKSYTATPVKTPCAIPCRQGLNGLFKNSGSDKLADNNRHDVWRELDPVVIGNEIGTAAGECCGQMDGIRQLVFEKRP